MNLNILKPRKALNKAFLKVKPNRTEIESFKQNLIKLTDHINEAETEEFHKNIVSTFLKDTYYKENHFINTKGRNDLVIHNGKDAKSTVGVIIEAKKPTNKTEMLKTDNINTKAFQELVLYYLRERITGKNLDVKYLIATNIYEWFIFDAQLFDKLFAHNKTFVNQFNDFEENRLSVHKTESFYKEIAEPFINEIKTEIAFTHFDIRDFNSIIRNADKHDDGKLITLYKLLSPEHLLKLPFVNDSNSLDKRFYSELLHIIGLTETKEGSKKLIERKKEGERNTGSLIENAIIQLDSLDKISRLEKPYRFGETTKEQLFNVALELAITWVNRILFLKLLEAQLISYHKGDKSYSFLNIEKVKNYDDLNNLFFQVLARVPNERNAEVKTAFAKVPYLNSSLFEPTPVEHSCLFISQLSDKKLPILSATVLKDTSGKKRTGEVDSLEYFFEFLDAYDFTSEGQEEIQEDNKTLINASVLGLIFEKINGYKDGSFFTPSFITMYMCRETIRRAVVQKFNSSPLLRGDGGVSSQNLNQANGMARRTIIPYNPKLKELARDLRNQSTKSEVMLWQQIKGKFEGKYDFHRQKPLDNYIADFYCHELKLVIEIDGETHNWQETQTKDFEKECRLNDLGLNVLRFPDRQIFENLESALDTIAQYIDGFEKGDLSDFTYEDTPLNPLSRGDFALADSNAKVPTVNQFNSLDEIYNEIGEGRIFSIKEANRIINSIKICDPAVGSGHFLVSALNEIIAVKSELRVLLDRNGKRLKEYHVEVENDELMITDEDGEFLEYNPRNPESQRVQETLFHEKQTIIESCLFGVDINPNSVKICRLRLWIELLKNAYYKESGELETLPNIDINIKCGNSLISRYALDADLGQALKKSKWSIDSYRLAVSTYRNAQNKEQKREMEKLILSIKQDFTSEIRQNDPLKTRLDKLANELYNRFTGNFLFEPESFYDGKNSDLERKRKQAQERLEKKIKAITRKIEEIKNNKIYENAFEWRFEFPEVLNDDGDFVGFDVIIENPPYVFAREHFDDATKKYFADNYPTSQYQVNLFFLFIERTISLLKGKGEYSLIVPNSLLMVSSAKELRKLLLSETSLSAIINLMGYTFEGVNVETIIFSGRKEKPSQQCTVNILANNGQVFVLNQTKEQSLFSKNEGHELNVFSDKESDELILKLNAGSEILDNLVLIKAGLQAYESGKGIPKQSAEDVKNRIYDYNHKFDSNTYEYLEGKDVCRYFLNWSGTYLRYGNHLAAPRTFDIFNGRKIIIREITGKHPQSIIATYSEDIYLFNRSNIAIIEKEGTDLSLKYVLAVLNSKLMSYYFIKNTAKSVRQMFPKLILEDLRKFPFKNVSKEFQLPLIALVEQILSTKSTDNNADTTNLETQIDQLVYQLYGLTEEEIKIVESC